MLLLGGHVKTGVDHAQGVEDALLQEHVEALTGDHLDDSGSDVGGDAVTPVRAGLKGQR